MSESRDWQKFNAGFVQASVAWAGSLLAGLASNPELQAADLAELPEAVAARQVLDELRGTEQESALETLASVFGLSSFEADVLALAVAVELDSHQATLCAKLLGHSGRGQATFGLAMTLFENPEWAALLPDSPLRYRYILNDAEPDAGFTLLTPLCLDERILAFVKGINVMDSRLSSVLTAPQAPDVSVPFPDSHARLVDDVMRALYSTPASIRPPVIRLAGDHPANKEAVAVEVAAKTGLTLYRLNASELPSDPKSVLSRLWQRESHLLPLALYICNDESASGTRVRLNQFLSKTPGVFFVDSDASPGRNALHEQVFEVGQATAGEQQAIWQAYLGEDAADFCGAVAEQFSLDAATIARLAGARSHLADSEAMQQDLWGACRRAARLDLDMLAERVDPRASWDDLVVPEETQDLLASIVNQVRHRYVVYERWGYRDKLNRGLGVSALFSGASGTGKTMAAEVIAGCLDLDLYRIDLSAVVSKYIGETAKNLRQIFSAAEDCGAILLFDEADAIFGKRTEVKDSHDRYANVDISYLLQRMEAYSGLAILASNFRKALDQAFVRRLRYIVSFERPSQAARAAIWKRVFPARLPLAADFDPERLAALQLTGGSIHSIAVQASFMAAAEGGELTMSTILRAARLEFDKLQRPAKETLFDWPDAAVDAVREVVV